RFAASSLSRRPRGAARRSRDDAKPQLRILRRQWPAPREPDPDVLLVRDRGAPRALGDPALPPPRAPLRGSAPRQRAHRGRARVPREERPPAGGVVGATSGRVA